MATKTQEDIVINRNGKHDLLNKRHLAPFQAKYMRRLVANFERAKASVDAAQNAANDFIVACGEEVGIQVGADGWTFDIDSLEFIKVPQGDADGNDS